MKRRLALVLAWVFAACGGQPAVDSALQRMTEQPRYDVFERSGFFSNGAVLQDPPEGTVPADRIPDPRITTGREPGGSYVVEVPVPVTAQLLGRGESRYDIYCAVCHGPAGGGRSVVAENMGERRPPPLRRAELRALPAGYFYEIVRNGLGVMPSYAAELPVPDRWAVVAYIRAGFGTTP